MPIWIMFLGLLFLLGMGFSLPLIGLAWLRNSFWKSKHHLKELQFLIEWSVYQCIVGGLMLVGVPIACFYLPAMMIVNGCILYAIVSVVSVVLIFYILNTDVSRSRFGKNL